MTQDDESALRKIEAFLESNNIQLDYGEEDENYIDVTENKIVVSTNQTSKEMIYTILHEIGHYFSEFHPLEESRTTRVIEEVLAWDIGRDVAYNLKIDIDEDIWSQIMIASVSKYINC